MTKTIEGTRGLIAGQSRYGKSYFTKKEFIPALDAFKPVVIFDRKEEYKGRFEVDNDKSWKGFNSAAAFFSQVRKDEKIGGVNVIKCKADNDYIHTLSFIHTLKKPVSLVLDEAHDIFLDKELYTAKKYLTKMVRYGASFGIDVILVTQRTHDMPPDIRSQFPWLISFKQRHETDVKTIDGMGFNQADIVQGLEKREKVLFGDMPDHLREKLDILNFTKTAN